MKKITLFVIAVGLLCSLVACRKADKGEPEPLVGAPVVATKSKPNILLVVADDMGYSDLGAFGAEIQTPHIDRLAEQGILLSNFHSTPVCSTTRASLLTGMDNHLVGIGTVPSAMAPNQKGAPGYEGYLTRAAATLPEILHDNGYNTYMAGKWHLGSIPEAKPSIRGFSRSFAMMTGGGAGHFDDFHAFAFGPGKANYQENGETLSLPEDFYSTKTYTEKIMEYIEMDRAMDAPFFAYLAYTAPHWPLQAPDESIAKYKGVYDEGFEAIRAARLVRQKALGLVPDDIQAAPDQNLNLPWSSLTSDQQKIEARKMEIYAAMVDDIDRYMGKLVQYLKDIGEYENTYIIFMSDNGPEGREIDDEIKINGVRLGEWIEKCCDNSYENMGRLNSYVWYGEQWGWVSATPLKQFKAFTEQGGIQVPAIISHPSFAANAGINSAFITVKDLMPTILEIVGIEHPETYAGQSILPIEGKSLVNLLSGTEKRVHADNYVTGWEFVGRRALRLGDWKIVAGRLTGDKGEWQLYNIADDPAELLDLAKERPKILEQMVAFWEQYSDDNNIILPEF